MANIHFGGRTGLDRTKFPDQKANDSLHTQPPFPRARPHSMFGCLGRITSRSASYLSYIWAFRPRLRALLSFVIGIQAPEMVANVNFE